jgi:hypothetical protein
MLSKNDLSPKSGIARALFLSAIKLKNENLSTFEMHFSLAIHIPNNIPHSFSNLKKVSSHVVFYGAIFHFTFFVESHFVTSRACVRSFVILF